MNDIPVSRSPSSKPSIPSRWFNVIFRICDGLRLIGFREPENGVQNVLAVRIEQHNSEVGSGGGTSDVDSESTLGGE
eukprot:190334-Amorphochlora_amoeboformis.AAC.1